MNPDMNPARRFCAQCGQELPAAARFCRACGTPVQASAAGEPPAAPATAALPPAAPDTVTAWAVLPAEEPAESWTEPGPAADSGDGAGDEERRRSPWLVTAMIAAAILVLGTGAYFGYGYLTSGNDAGNDSGADRQAGAGQTQSADAPASASATPSATGSAKATASASPSASGSASPSSTPSSSPRTTATAGPPSGSTGSYGAAGWDTGALNAAYCQHDGEFVTVADSPKFQGVICQRSGGLVYRGLDKSNGLTMSTGAEKTPSGYAGVLGNTRYEISAAAFTITLNGEEIASDKVTTYVTPDQEPFRPGDLGLSVPIDYPQCDGSAAVLLVSSFGAANAARDIKVQLEQHPGARYLRTDLSCDGFNRTSDERGNREPIYAAYLPAGSDTASICSLAAASGTYAVWLQNGITPDESRVDCP